MTEHRILTGILTNRVTMIDTERSKLEAKRKRTQLKIQVKDVLEKKQTLAIPLQR